MVPELRARLGARRMGVAVAPSGAEAVARFDVPGHLAALAATPPSWPGRTNAVSLLALDLDIGRTGFGLNLPPRRLRLELLDYPGEWLLDLPLLTRDFASWSETMLRRLEGRAEARAFLAFATALPAEAAEDEALAATGHALYLSCLGALREAGLSFLQPGRFLMPPPGPAPGWMGFFPARGRGGLQRLLSRRYNAFRAAVRRDLAAPLFADADRLVVLADLLAGLSAGPEAFADAAGALHEAAGFLSRPRALLFGLNPRTRRRRLAFVASKADHVAERQRGNLARLTEAVALPGRAGLSAAGFAVAAIRCTEDVTWALDGHPVSAVRGRVLGGERLTRSYPGEVPDQPPNAAFWRHPFLAVPQFEPPVLPGGGKRGVPEIGLGALLCFLLEDVL